MHLTAALDSQYRLVYGIIKEVDLNDLFLA